MIVISAIAATGPTAPRTTRAAAFLALVRAGLRHGNRRARPAAGAGHLARPRRRPARCLCRRCWTSGATSSAAGDQREGRRAGREAAPAMVGHADWFAFDMAVPDMVQHLRAGMPTYTRMSEYEYAPACFDRAAGIWLDAFEATWFDAALHRGLPAGGKRVCVVSPELHGRPAALCGTCCARRRRARADALHRPARGCGEAIRSPHDDPRRGVRHGRRADRGQGLALRGAEPRARPVRLRDQPLRAPDHL